MKDTKALHQQENTMSQLVSTQVSSLDNFLGQEIHDFFLKSNFYVSENFNPLTAGIAIRRFESIPYKTR
jgi:hypothetical protein